VILFNLICSVLFIDGSTCGAPPSEAPASIGSTSSNDRQRVGSIVLGLVLDVLAKVLHVAAEAFRSFTGRKELQSEGAKKGQQDDS
jgi:hypothetical protein